MPQGLGDGRQGGGHLHPFAARRDALDQLQRGDGVALALAGKDVLDLAQHGPKIQGALLLHLGQHVDRELRDVAHWMA